MSEQNTAVAHRPEQAVEYVPYGSDSKIKLSAKIVQTLIAVPTRSGKTCSDRDAIRFVAMCQARKLNPFEGDAFLIGFDGKNGPEFSLITAHQSFLKRAELHPEFNGMTSGVIISPGTECPACDTRGVIEKTICPLCRGRRMLDEVEGDLLPDDAKLVGGWAVVWFRNRQEPMRKRLNLSTFAKGYGVWQTNPAGMIVKCAEADALRSAFPTMLGGMYLREEIDLVQVSALPEARQTLPPAPPQKTSRLAERATDYEPNPTPRSRAEESAPISDEQAEAAAGLAPEQPSATHTAGPGSPTIQEELASIVTGAGFTYTDFSTWGKDTQGSGGAQTGMLAWDTFGGFEDVPPKAAAFFVKAKRGMLTGLAAAKGGAS